MGLTAGVLVASAGAAAAAGRLTGSWTLVQWPAGLAPMSLAASLALLISGLGSVAAHAGPRWRWPARASGALVAAVALVFLAGDAAVGRLLAHAWLHHGGAKAVSMAPYTALALALAGAALFASGIPLAQPILGSMCAALGAGALLGHALGVDPAFGLGAAPSSAVPTATCLVLLGCALTSRRGAPGGSGARFEAWRTPALIGVAVAAVALLFAQALAARDAAHRELLMNAGARRVRAEIRAGLDARTELLSVLAREWEARLLPLRSAWESDARITLAQSSGFDAVEWVDPDGEVTWRYPRDAALPPVDGASLRRAAAAPTSDVVAGPFPLPDGDYAFRILVPLRSQGELEGWLSGTFSSRDWLSRALANVEASRAVRVRVGRTQLLQTNPPAGDAEQSGSRELALPLPGGATLDVLVQPSREAGELVASRLPQVVVVGGLAVSLLLTLALGLRTLAADRARALESEIAGHRRAEEEIRRLNLELEARVRGRTEELSRSNRDLKQFASFLSHELRQPLSAQAIWTELLASTCGESLGAEGRQYLAEIRSAARKMGDMISAQLALASLQAAGSVEATARLARVVEAVLSDLKPRLERAGASVEVGPLPTVRGDPVQLHQLFRNLVENSVKYRRPGVAPRIRIHGELGAAGEVNVVIEDNGRGFAAEEAERIFRPSERLGASGAVEGFGLGLAICRRIAERHGGTLMAAGHPGAGARFLLRLPAAEPGDAA